MSTTQSIPHATGDRQLWLWGGVVAAPILWFADQQTHLLLVSWACRSGQLWLLHLSSALFLLSTCAVGATAFWKWRGHSGAHSEGFGVGSGAGFLALLGVWSSGLFALLIVAQAIPVFVIDPCQP